MGQNTQPQYGTTTNTTPNPGSAVGGATPTGQKPGISGQYMRNNLNSNQTGNTMAVSPTGGIPRVGGPAVNPELLTPTGPVENFLLGQSGNPAGMQFRNDIASGQIPPGIMQQFLNQQQTQQGGILESMRGSRFGTSAVGILGREQGRSLTDLLAGTEKNALSAQAGQDNLIQQLFMSELSRQGQGRQLEIQSAMNSAGLPPELAVLLGASSGGGSASGSGLSGQVNPLINMIGSIGKKPGGGQ